MNELLKNAMKNFSEYQFINQEIISNIFLKIYTWTVVLLLQKTSEFSLKKAL